MDMHPMGLAMNKKNNFMIRISGMLVHVLLKLN
jgi:hypothetical protein